MAGTENWFGRWLEERARYPRWLLARVREPVREGDEVSVEVLRDVDRRASLGLPLDLQRTNVSELPFCLLREKVDGKCAAQLTTALCIVRSVQGLEFREGLEFLSQLFLITGDWVRYRRGGSSLFSQVCSSLCLSIEKLTTVLTE